MGLARAWGTLDDGQPLGHGVDDGLRRWQLRCLEDLAKYQAPLKGALTCRGVGLGLM